MGKSLSYAGAVFLIGALSFLAYMTYGFAKNYDEQLRQIAQTHTIEKKVDDLLANSLERVTKEFFSLAGGTVEQKKGESSQLSVDYGAKVRQTTIWFMGVMVLVLLSYFVFPRNVFVFTVLIASLISWFVGVFTPVMTVEVWKNLPVLGHTTFLFQSKGIWSTIERLYAFKNYIVAVLVFVFSILIPIVKTIALFIAVGIKSDAGFIEKIGKWSMADVFVVSILLSTMSLNAEDMTTAKVHVAIYFFALYVILSIIGSSVVKKEYGKGN